MVNHMAKQIISKQGKSCLIYVLCCTEADIIAYTTVRIMPVKESFVDKLFIICAISQHINKHLKEINSLS